MSAFDIRQTVRDEDAAMHITAYTDRPIRIVAHCPRGGDAVTAALILDPPPSAVGRDGTPPTPVVLAEAMRPVVPTGCCTGCDIGAAAWSAVAHSPIAQSGPGQPFAPSIQVAVGRMGKALRRRARARSRLRPDGGHCLMEDLDAGMQARVGVSA